jgi:hypothetical protein
MKTFLIILILAVVFYKLISAVLSARSKASNEKADQVDAEDGGDKAGKAIDEKAVELRVQLPTGEKGTVIYMSPNVRQIAFDSESGEENIRKLGGDPEKTAIVIRLLEVPPEERDEHWNEAFLANLIDAGMDGGREGPREIEAPDGFHYICLDSPESGKTYTPQVIRRLIPAFLQDACGVAINVGKGQPDWVLFYGDIVNFYLNGEFRYDDDRFEKFDSPAPATEEVAEGGEQVWVGDPSSDILPQQVRAALRRFLLA